MTTARTHLIEVIDRCIPILAQRTWGMGPMLKEALAAFTTPQPTALGDEFVFLSLAEAQDALAAYVAGPLAAEGAPVLHSGVERYEFQRHGAQGFAIWVRRNGWRSGYVVPQ